MLDMNARDKQAFRALIDLAGEQEPRESDDSLGKLLGAFKSSYPDGPPDPLRSRLPTLERIFAMADDPGWNLPSLDKKRIGSTFRYLLRSAGDGTTEAENALLQAAAIDLMAADCAAELQLYDEFCAARNSATDSQSVPITTRSEWLSFKRIQLLDQPKRRLFGMRRSRLSSDNRSSEA